MKKSPPAEPVGADTDGRCTHPTLVEMPALYGWYRCPACGDFFNLELIHLVRHTPRDLRAMADAFLDALGRPAGRVFSTDPAPAVPPSAGAGKDTTP